MRDVLREYADSRDEDRRYLSGSYRFVDMARKVVSVGSVGTRAAVFLLVGREGKDPLVLQAKEAPSVGTRALSGRQRVQESWRAGGPGSADLARRDGHSSWLDSQHGPRGPEARLLRVPAVGLDGVNGPHHLQESRLHAYTRACGWSLARAHARSGDRVAMAAYLGAGPESIRPSSPSPRNTPTRTSWTAHGWSRRSRRAKFRHGSGFEWSGTRLGLRWRTVGVPAVSGGGRRAGDRWGCQ
jgi:hypothetical protein